MMFIGYVFLLFTVYLMEAHACDEPAVCAKNKKLCAVREKFRERCPCTCAADISFTECCAKQSFEHEECRELCSFDTSVKGQRKIKPMALKCFNDLFKVQYCLSNGYKPYTDCCEKNRITRDTPEKPGCMIFCEGKTPACSKLFDYFHCSSGEQYVKAMACARETHGVQEWKSNFNDVHKCT
uniref:Domain of unknown function DB domain-containing protein n=1 Tax=Plectus sambesii TaxID=2011161 RepID=A0A914VXZ1_9BILA